MSCEHLELVRLDDESYECKKCGKKKFLEPINHPITADISKCPFCEIGQARRAVIWRYTYDLSRKDVEQMIRERNEHRRYAKMS